MKVKKNLVEAVFFLERTISAVTRMAKCQQLQCAVQSFELGYFFWPVDIVFVHTVVQQVIVVDRFSRRVKEYLYRSHRS